MNEYDIEKAFRAIENELMASMIRNMQRHRAEEIKEGYNWIMWQAEQLKSLERYKHLNKKKFVSKFSDINNSIRAIISSARQQGEMEQEISILKAIKGGFTGYKKSGSTMQAEFFLLNERKLESLIKATTDDMKKAETAVLRMANDQYRKIIFNAQVYANTGAGTYEKAVDMATKDFLSAGLNCVEYANGARHTLSDYAAMAIQTASKRAYLQGEGKKRQQWGITTVIMNKRGNPCPKCLPFVGKVLIDDVWSGGSPKDGDYPLMSRAIAAGLYHPRCRDSHTTYFKGISPPPDSKFLKKEIRKIEENYQKEQKKQYANRQIEKYERLCRYSLDKDNHKGYFNRAESWKRKLTSYRLKDSEGIYLTLNNGKHDIIKPRNISKNLRKSNIGLETLQYLEENNVLVQLVYGVDNPYAALGFYDPYDDIIQIFVDKTKSIEKTAEVIIHEATHRKYGIGGNQWSEAVCIAQEIKHRNRSDRLTSSQRRDIIKTTKDLYPDFKWKEK